MTDILALISYNYLVGFNCLNGRTGNVLEDFLENFFQSLKQFLRWSLDCVLNITFYKKKSPGHTQE